MKKEGILVNYEISNKTYIFVAIFFILAQLTVFIRNGFDYSNFFWFCNFASILFAISFLIRKPLMIKALINLSLIPSIFFLIDFFISLFFNFGIFGRVQSYFQEDLIFISITVLLHITVFLAIFLTYRFKPDVKTLLLSFYIVVGIYLMTLIFSSPDSYYNYIYNTRPGYFHPNISYQIVTILWPILVFIFLVLPAQAIQYWLYKLSLKK